MVNRLRSFGWSEGGDADDIGDIIADDGLHKVCEVGDEQACGPLVTLAQRIHILIYGLDDDPVLIDVEAGAAARHSDLAPLCHAVVVEHWTTEGLAEHVIVFFGEHLS